MSLIVLISDIVNHHGDANVSLDNIAGGFVAGAREFLLTGEDLGDFKKIKVDDFDKTADEIDVVVDLSTFSSDFELDLKDERVADTLTLKGADEIVVSNNGTRTVTFTGADGETHELKIKATVASVEVARDGGVEIGPGVGLDNIEGGDGGDTISGGAGHDTIAGGAGDDNIISGVDATDLGGSGERSYDFPLIRLGQAADVDVNENDGRSENAEDLLGTYGGDDNPLSGSIVFAVSNDLNQDDNLDDNDNGRTAETFTINGEEIALDSVQVYNAQVEFVDGTTGNFSAVVIQLENGEFFLAPEPMQNADSALLISGEIKSITLENLIVDDTNLYGLRLDMAYAVGDDDSVNGGSGDDTIQAGVGDDFVEGGIGGDHVFGGAGADQLYGGSGDDVLEGGSGEDYLKVGSGNDVAYGGAGDDTLQNASGDDLLFGGAGDDSLVANFGDDSLFGGSGADTLIGGSGDDSLVGGSGDDFLLGVDFDDITDTGTNTIYGGDGADVIAGGTLGDSLFGGTGNDRIEGRDGGDTIFGGAGADLIVGYDATSINGSNPSVLRDDGAADIIDGGSGDDTIVGGGGGDTLDGGSGNDEISGGSGDDFITVGLGQDTAFGGVGDDTILNASGDDSLVGGSGDDSIVATGGADTLEGGAGADTLIGGSGDDSLVGGAGDDQIFGGSGDDQAFGGSGDDTFQFADNFGNDTIAGGEGGTDFDTLDFSGLTSPVTINFSSAEAGTASSGGYTITFSEIEHFLLTDGDDLVFGGNTAGSHFIEAGAGDDQIESTDGDDTVIAGSGDDSIDGNHGADLIFGGDGADTLDGDEEADTLHGGSGDDLFLNGSGNDVAFGGEGEDTLGGSSGDDSLTGGEGFDTFVIGSGDDTISDFGTATGAVLNDGDQTNNDFVDLSVFYDNISEVRADFDDDGVLNQSNVTDDKGRATDFSDNTAMSGSTRFSGVSSSDEFTQDTTDVVCFAKGTMITTPTGDVPVECLSAGDLVETMDHEAQPIAWIGQQTICAKHSACHDNLKPIRIEAGALGSGLPHKDLFVSQQHRMLISGPIAKRMFDDFEVLMPAKALLGAPGVSTVEIREDFNLVHFMFENHEIVFADGAPSETFFPGPMALRTLQPKEREAVLNCFLRWGRIERPAFYPARRFVKVSPGRSLIARHVKNGKPLLGSEHLLPAFSSLGRGVHQ